MSRITLEFRVIAQDAAPARAITLPARTRAAKSARRPATKRSLLGSATFVVATLIVAMLATTGSYALWNGKVQVSGSTLSTGSTALTINGGSSYTLALPTAGLAPGQSAVASATFANVGTTPLSATATSVSILSDTNGLSNYLTLNVTQVASAAACTAGLTGGTSASLASFNTSASPYQVPAGASFVVCFELKLSSSAPISVAGGATSWRMNIAVNQVRP